MADSLFDIAFDPQSLAEIAQLSQFSTFLEPEVGDAMQKAGQLVQQAAQDNAMTVFEHPTGELASSIESISESPWEIIVGTNSPYGRRRELGFSGMTDSLGRHFTNDPGKPFLSTALEDNSQQVLSLVDDAVAAALDRLTSGGSE